MSATDTWNTIDAYGSGYVFGYQSANKIRNDLLVAREKCIASLTNKSGGALSAGAVVIVNSASAESFTTTATPAVGNIVGVVIDSSIADNAAGLVAFFGIVGTLSVTAATSIGNFLGIGSTAGQADPKTAWDDACFAVAISSSAGAGTVSAILLGAVPRTQHINDPIYWMGAI